MENNKIEACKTKEDIIQILEEFLKYITEYGNCYVCMREIEFGEKNYNKAWRLSENFFLMAHRSLKLNILTNLYRIYDKHDKSVGIKGVLKTIQRDIADYDDLCANKKSEIEHEIKKFKENKSLKTIVAKLRELRVKRLAHFDNDYFLRSEELFDDSKLTHEDLVCLMESAYHICAFIHTNLTGVGHFRFWGEPYIQGNESPYLSNERSSCSDIRKLYENVDKYLKTPRGFTK